MPLLGVSLKTGYIMNDFAARVLALLPNPTDYIQLSLPLVDEIGMNPAILLSRMHWRFEGGWRLLHEHEGHHWWEATYADLAKETRLTTKQVRTSLDTLIELDLVVREKHFLDGPSDHSYSYRARTADEARSLLPTDVPSRAHQENSDVPSRAHRSALQGTSTSVKTSRNSLNTDSVGDEESELFELTVNRAKLVTDAMIDSGQRHAVSTYLEYLQTLDWRTARELVRKWCGIQAAALNGEGFRRNDIDQLLLEAGIEPIDDTTWREFLASTNVGKPDPGHCRYDEVSGYCDQHGLRLDQHA